MTLGFSIQNFEEWLNESAGPGAAEKVISEFERWARELGLKPTVNRSSFDESVSLWVDVMGLWELSYERSTRKSGQDSMYRQTYEKGENYKWHIKYPKKFSQYNSRGNVKPGNLKTFKALIERFMVTKEKYEMVSGFLKLLDRERFDGDMKIAYEGKNLKDLHSTLRIANDGDISDAAGFRLDDMSKWSARYGVNGGSGGLKFEREDFDPSTGALFYYAMLATNQMNHRIEDTQLLDILEELKDQPVEKVWNELRSGDWKALKHKYRGAVTGKRYGV